MVTSGTALNDSAKTPKFSWDEKISRAQKLSGVSATTKEILALYIRITKFQRAISNGLNERPKIERAVGTRDRPQAPAVCAHDVDAPRAVTRHRAREDDALSVP